MKNKKAPKYILAVLLVSIVMAINLISCRGNESTVHKGFEEFETLIYSELGDYIKLGEPHFDEEHKSVGLGVYFKDAYLKDEVLIEEHPQYEIIDRYMYLFNQFIQDNPGYFFGEDNIINVTFYGEEHTYFGGSYYDTIAKLVNSPSTSNRTEKRDRLCGVEYYCITDYAKLTCRDDIEYLYVEFFTDYEDSYPKYVCDVIRLFPNLKRVNYSDFYNVEYSGKEVENAIHEQYPELEIGE